MLQSAEEKAQGDLIANLYHIRLVYKKNGERLFTRVCSGRTSGKSLKLNKDRFRLGIRKIYFTIRVVMH